MIQLWASGVMIVNWADEDDIDFVYPLSVVVCGIVHIIVRLVTCLCTIREAF